MTKVSGNIIFLFTLVMSGLIVALPFAYPSSYFLHFLGYFVLAASMPFKFSADMLKISKAKSLPVKWRLFSLAAVGLGMLSLTMLIVGIIFVCVSLSSGKGEPKPKPIKTDAYAEVYATLNMTMILPFQLMVMLGMVGTVVLPLYRIDWILDHERPGVRLTDYDSEVEVEVEREIFSTTRPKLFSTSL
jgi:hypothetical protein